MEDILDTYKLPVDAKKPLVCMDESPKQLIEETRIPIPASEKHNGRFDTEYKRNGVCEEFMFCAPLLGWRRASITETRTKKDWANQIKILVDEDFPDAEKIILVMDNLNTHTIASLYEAFTPKEARRIAEKLEIHYTPKHGSWLNMAEIEFNVLNNHGLANRIPTIEEVRQQTDAWCRLRNKECRKIDWQFTTDDARIKLRHLYPHFET
jgi:transposase